MTILHLGVIDIPYANAPRPKGTKAGSQSTGDVAGWLENKYGIMQRFGEVKAGVISDALAHDVAGSLETMMMGGPSRLHFGTATGKIEDSFRQFLSSQEVEKIGIAGVPTAAALSGISHRFKNPRRKGGKRRARRPSFLDTGLYSRSFRSWID